MSAERSVRKALIPAAGYGTRLLPATKAIRKELFPMMDRDGIVKPVIQMIVEEAVASGIEEICIVVAPGGADALRSYFSKPGARLRAALARKPETEEMNAELVCLGKRITYVTQPARQGYGDAVLCARDWVRGEPVLVMLGDHVYMSGTPRRCARQLMDAFERREAPVSGVIRRGEQALRLFGTVAGRRVHPEPPTYRVRRIVEKPDIDYARTHLRVPGLPGATYLCFFGLHVLTPEIFDCLAALKSKHIRSRGELGLTEAQAILADAAPYYACEIDGRPFDIGVPEGFARTMRAFAQAAGAG